MKLVLFDASWLAHRAKHAFADAIGGGDYTPIIYGMLEQIRAVCMNRRVASTLAVVCFDSKQSIRKQSFPDYKKKRWNKKTPVEKADHIGMQGILRTMRKEVLPAIGFPCLRQTGLESDDVMAQAATQVPLTGAVLITADSDLYQCISGNVYWYDPAREKYMDVHALLSAKAVWPGNWADLKAMTGCDTDEVPGIPGVGEKTAADYLWKRLDAKSKRYGDITSKTGQAIIKRNLRLVQLPHRATRMVEVPTNPKYEPDALLELGKQYKFTSYVKTGDRWELWQRFFRGTIGPATDRVKPLRRRK